jgi:hypothetical protein
VKNVALEDLKEIGLYGGGIIIVLMTMIQISPIKINPWSWLGRIIGRAINAEVIEKVDKISIDVKNNKDTDDREWAELRRTHILRFGDEIRLGISHSEEHFNQILLDIHNYEKYCDEHKSYKNDKAVTTIELIRHTYSKCLSENLFL